MTIIGIGKKHSLWWMDKKNSTASYSSEGSSKFEMKSYSKLEFNGYLNRLKKLINFEKCKDPYLGLRTVEVFFKEPYLQCGECEVIALAVMRVLMKYVYNTVFDSAKFTIGYVLKVPTGDVSFTIGTAISLNSSNGDSVPNKHVYAMISKFLMKKAEDYEKDWLSCIFVRVYYTDMLKEKEFPLSSDEMDTQIYELIKAGIGGCEPQEVQAMSRGRKRSFPDHLTALKPMSKERKPFIVADMETVLVDNVHVPYAVGFLVVKPGEDVCVKPDYSIETYFSEDIIFQPEIKDRSNIMLLYFLERLAVVADETKIRTVYFHNLSRFDGLFIMKYYASHGDKYTIKPLIRNNRLYDLPVYRGKKLVFRLRDSFNLFTNSLAKLAKTLCPLLGSKGSIDHDEIRVSNLKTKRAELLDYMKQDIRLLGGVMLKGQEIYWTEFQVDIVNCLTLSALSMRIFRMRYYDPNSFPIHIPSRNVDTFIRRGYYGGHADTYKPYGENLHYYDVNSLYPYIMKTFPMPGGVPVWHGNLEGQELSNLYGFIEAYVVCPRTITRPFLPYRDHNDTLLFPTGKFVGVYFSEELIYARDLGYKIIPLRGYLFEKKTSPFENFVSSVYGKRLEAKKADNEPMVYGYKIIMNSLYGRFGINPKSTITEICNRDRYNYLLQRDNFHFGEKLSDDYYIVSYISNILDSDWNPPKISAVQLSAAITACSRIHMYKYISRPDCYYTDTDSAILASPLPEDDISSTELGKLKKEHNVKRAIFLAPKSYTLITDKNEKIMKHKGAAKDSVNLDWFESQYADPSRTEMVPVESRFSIDWHTLQIAKKVYQVTLGIKVDRKRVPVYDNNNVWVDTLPKDVIDFGGQESSILPIELKNLQEMLDMKEKEYAQILASLHKENDQRIASLESELAKLREEIQSQSAKLPEEPVMRPLTESPTGLEQPTLYKHPTEGKKPKGKPKGKSRGKPNGKSRGKPNGKKSKAKKPKAKKPKENDTS